MVADHQVSQHQGRIGRVQQDLSWRAQMSGPVKFVMALDRRLADYPFRAPGLPWYFIRAFGTQGREAS
jgi:hypothetical protein